MRAEVHGLGLRLPGRYPDPAPRPYSCPARPAPRVRLWSTNPRPGVSAPGIAWGGTRRPAFTSAPWPRPPATPPPAPHGPHCPAPPLLSPRAQPAPSPPQSCAPSPEHSCGECPGARALTLGARSVHCVLCSRTGGAERRTPLLSPPAQGSGPLAAAAASIGDGEGDGQRRGAAVAASAAAPARGR